MKVFSKHQRGRGDVLAHLSGLLGVLALSGLILSACASPKDTLGTTTSPCFRSLGVAATAVQYRGHYAGVQSISAADLRKLLTRIRPTAVPVPPKLSPITGTVCLVFYRGTYTRAEVKDPWPPSRTRSAYAIVVVPEPHDEVLVTFLANRPFLRSTRIFLNLR